MKFSFHISGTRLRIVVGMMFLLLAIRGQMFAENPESTALASDSLDRVGPVKLHEVPLDQILELLERWTGKAILRPQVLPPVTLSLNLKEEVTKLQAIRAVETLMGLNGIGVTTLDENFIKIVPLNVAKAEAPELIMGSTLELPPSGRTATKIFKLKYLRASEFVPQITGLLNTAVASAPSLFEKANSVIVTDSISNLQRIETVLLQVDQPEGAAPAPKFYTLNNAKASDVVSKIRSLLLATQQNDPHAARYGADERTNQIILFANSTQYPVFDDLISKLDVKSGQDTRNEIIYLKHAAAKDVAAILSRLVSGQTASGKITGQDLVQTISRPSAAIAEPNNQSPPTSIAIVQSTDGTTSTPSTQFSVALTILAEDRANAIVVSGTIDDIRLINEMVSKIDILLAQVRIEVVIAEVTLNDDSTSGISQLGLKIEGDKLTGFAGSFPGLTISDGTVTRPGGGDNNPIITSGKFDLAGLITLSATPRKSNANILSVPNIITTHNREGKIFVGEERPVISSYLNDGNGGSVAGSNSVGSGYRSTVNSKDIGISLSVKPLIGADGSVQLEIKQEVNDILGEITIDGNPQPRIGRRTTESFVSARSGEIIVLGGLQRSMQSKSTNRLGPIPIIGDLLGTRSREKTRTDLVFFLRPTVLTSTPTDNVAAYHQVEQFPKAQRLEVERLLEIPSGQGELPKGP